MASHPIMVTRKERYEKVWSQTVHTLAKEYGHFRCWLEEDCTTPASFPSWRMS
jgi:hypothetical protein